MPLENNPDKILFDIGKKFKKEFAYLTKTPISGWTKIKCIFSYEKYCAKDFSLLLERPPFSISNKPLKPNKEVFSISFLKNNVNFGNSN